MSLDDPNVIAGIATDGTPFFDDPNQAHNQARSTATATSGSTTTTSDVDTPMPLKGGSGQLQLLSVEESHHQKFPLSATAGAAGDTPSREKDSKELKEFWKQYMRIPLSGSEILPLMPGSEGVTPSGGNASKATNMSGPGPGPGYRRQRVASLPAVKTPIVERARDHLDAAVYLNTAQHPSASTLNAGTGDDTRLATGTAYLRRPSTPEVDMDMDTGIDNSEDLRSYEAAVMARKAPTMLNLKRPMKGRGRAIGGTTKGKLRDEGSASATSASSGNNSPRAMVSGDIMESSSSSLANAFGTGRVPVSSHSRDQTVLSAPGTLPIAGGGRVKKEEKSSSPLLSSSPTSSCDDNHSDLGSMEGPSPLMINSSSSGRNNIAVGRPSFKRLPSQTLGPDYSKRTFYGFGGEVDDRVVSGWGATGGNDGDDRRDVLGGGGGSAERRMRKRRMSEPSTGLTGGHGAFDREDHLKRSSRADVSAVQNVDELWFY